MTAHDFWRYLLWPPLAGLVFFMIGLISARRDLWGKHDLTILGRAFVPLALAAFGAEHMTSANHIMEMVPPWMPARLFWAYFVGFALFAAAASIALMKYVRWSAALLGLMLFLFVILIHVEAVAAHPGDRFRWAVMVRDLSFALGAWALAGTQIKESQGRDWLIAACRIGIGAVLVFYSFEHFLHPAFLPGVPLEQQTPAWFPLRPLWGLLMGAVLLGGGVLVLINKHARAAATWVAIPAAIVVLIIYFPLLFSSAKPLDVTVAVNYIADTLLFAGSILFLAAAIPVGESKAPARGTWA